MAGEDKNLRETLKEAVGEVNDQAKTAKDKETNSELSKSQETETNAGEPVYVSGIDISDVPAADRPRIKELLEKKAKNLESGWQTKFKEVAEFKKAQDELIKAGLSVAEAQEVLNKHIEAKRQPTNAEKKDAKKLLDNLIDSAPLEQKESLRQLRQILMEETNVGELQKKVSEMETMLKSVSHGYVDVKRKEVETVLVDLSKKYGKDLIEKYRDVIIDESIKYNVPPIKVLFNRADEDEIEQAISAKGKRSQEKLNAISSSGSGITGSGEMLDTKKAWKPFLQDILKQRK